jgi:hypothetical protein
MSVPALPIQPFSEKGGKKENKQEQLTPTEALTVLRNFVVEKKDKVGRSLKPMEWEMSFLEFALKNYNADNVVALMTARLTFLSDYAAAIKARGDAMSIAIAMAESGAVHEKGVHQITDRMKLFKQLLDLNPGKQPTPTVVVAPRPFALRGGRGGYRGRGRGGGHSNQSDQKNQDP